MQTRLERRHNILAAAASTAVPFGFIHLLLAFLSEITIASVLISLAAYILLGLFLRPLVGIVLRGCRESLACRRPDAQRVQPDQQRQRHRGSLLNGELYRVEQWSYSSPYLHCWQGADGSPRPTART